MNCAALPAKTGLVLSPMLGKGVMAMTKDIKMSKKIVLFAHVTPTIQQYTGVPSITI